MACGVWLLWLRRKHVRRNPPNLQTLDTFTYHSKNVSAAELVRSGAVDALASDYVPASLVEAAFACVKEGGIALPAGIALVTANPAAMAGLVT